MFIFNNINKNFRGKNFIVTLPLTTYCLVDQQGGSVGGGGATLLVRWRKTMHTEVLW